MGSYASEKLEIFDIWGFGVLGAKNEAHLAQKIISFSAYRVSSFSPLIAADSLHVYALDKMHSHVPDSSCGIWDSNCSFGFLIQKFRIL